MTDPEVTGGGGVNLLFGQFLLEMKIIWPRRGGGGRALHPTNVLRLNLTTKFHFQIFLL